MKRRISHSEISKAFSPDPSALLTRLSELDIEGQPISRVTTADGDLRKPITPVSGTPLSITGEVIEEKSGLPLAGVTVKWALGTVSKRASRHRRNEIGSAVTDEEGRFVIDAATNLEAKAALCATESSGGKNNGATYLYLADQNEKMIGRPIKVPADTRQIVLHPPAAGPKPIRKQWKALTNYLTANRMMLVRDVAQQLAHPFADSPIRDWTVPARASGLRALLEAVARQHKKVAEQLDLLYQNQFIDTAALEEGNVRRAVNHFADGKNLDQFLPGIDKIFPWLRDSDRSLYRDYLRGIWVGAAQMMYKNEESIAKPAVALLDRQLDERFEQDFHTNDDTEQPTAQSLVPLLKLILMRDASRGGFGLKVADIPAQGTQTDDEYLQSLIALSGVSAQELRNRFRVSFERNPGETTSPLQLNVEALLGLLADTYQSPQEPFPAVPTAVEGKPLIFGPYIGRAPFFLEYEEWLERQRTFFPENIYNIRKNVPLFYPEFRNLMKGDSASKGAPSFPGEGYFDRDPGERARSAAWIERMFPIADKLREAFAKIDSQLYPDALAKLQEASDLLKDADKNYEWPWVKDKFWWQSKLGSWNNVPAAYKPYSDVWVSLVDRAKIKVTAPDQLESFERFFEEPVYNSDYEVREKGMAKSRTLYHYGVFYLNLVLIPYLRSQIYFAQGDFAKALTTITPLTGYRVGIAETTSAPGYATLSEPVPGQDQTDDSFARYPRLHHLNTLPYTTLVGFDEDKSGYADLLAPVGSMGAMVEWKNIVIAPFELRFFKLAQADLMLAWADQLYRNDDPSSIRRARELYKDVLFMHGEDPEIAPHFARPGHFGLGLLGGDPLFWKYNENPAKVSQINRARLALYQIGQGLNIYGYRDDMVPVLRYKPLKQAADLFATSAKSAQTDFLNYMTHYEQALIELWQTQSLMKKAQASSGIASEHVAIAQVGVDKAKEQVTAVQAQIAAKQKEIADKNSLFEQFSDYLSGAKDALTGMVPLAQKVMAEDSAASSSGVTGEQMMNIFSKGASGGAGGAEEAASTALGSGAAFMVGYGAFVYASYNSMEAMASASAKRDGELKALQTTALDAANAQVRLKQRDVTIAQYESQIAAADLEFANMLFRFQQDRFLNADFWNKMTLFANRLMRRYVELGARTAWMAERALAFEQGRAVNIIKLNYLPITLRGVTGADRLLADLAELEANRIQGTRLTTPVKHTVSLAREFPIAFGQLKKTGRCRFHTREGDLRRAYPGSFAYRIRAITIAVHDTDGAPPRGMLRNGGVSIVSTEDLTNKVLVRYPDALALSEFRLHEDLFVYGLPGETLLQFEGSGFETDWEVDFPVEANPKGLRSMADVLMTFDSNAYYSDAVAAKQAAQPLADAPRSIMLAASNLDPKGLDTLKATSGAARITFDPTKLALPLQEIKRSVANLAIICVGNTTKKYDAKLTAGKSTKTAAFKIEDGIAMSNDGPLQGTAGPLPLNTLVGLNLNQPFVLEIDRTGVAAELKQLFDVVLYLEYTASF
jgi:hypothetical protein